MAAIAGGDVSALERLYRALRVPVYATALAIVAGTVRWRYRVALRRLELDLVGDE